MAEGCERNVLGDGRDLYIIGPHSDRSISHTPGLLGPEPHTREQHSSRFVHHYHATLTHYV